MPSGSEPMIISLSEHGLELDTGARVWLGAESPVANERLSKTGPKLLSPRLDTTFADWLWHEISEGDRSGRWIVFCEDGLRIDTALADTRATLNIDQRPDASTAKSLRHEVRNFVNAVQVNAELIALHGERAGEPKFGELIGRIKRSCASLEAVLDAERSSDGGSCAAVAGIAELLTRSGVRNVVAETDTAMIAPVQWCLSASHAVLEWLAAERDGLADAARVTVDVDAGRRSLRVSIDGFEPDARRDLDSLFRGGETATSDSAIPSAPEALKASGIGYGIQRSRDASAVYIALP